MTDRYRVIGACENLLHCPGCRAHVKAFKALEECELYFDNWCQDEPTAQKAMTLVQAALAAAKEKTNATL